MENSQDRKFPSAFGTSPDDFLEQYESLIYKIIYEQTRENSRFEAEDLFQEFFIHIAENNFSGKEGYLTLKLSYQHQPEGIAMKCAAVRQFFINRIKCIPRSILIRKAKLFLLGLKRVSIILNFLWQRNH